ncbi:MAG: FHA domain-containing protein [Lachnospiraceae bacterium]|nr:FHA domain-containing protein [Lachnospiraceae bacterium]
MSKIVVKNKKGKVIIVNKLTYPEAINERIYTTIASGMYSGFIPLTIQQKRKETRIECVVQDLILVKDYFSGIVTKKMFLDFVQEIIDIIKCCDKDMININNLDLQADRIFVEPQSKKVKCIFWPIVNNQQTKPIQIFFEKLPDDIRFNPYEDCKYIEVYKQFFDGTEPFSIYSLERLVLRLQGKQSIAGLSTPSISLSASSDYEQSDGRKKDEIKKINIEYDPFSRVNNIETISNRNFAKYFSYYCSFCGNKISSQAKFCELCGEKVKQEEVQERSAKQDVLDYATTVLGDNTNGTSILGCEKNTELVAPILIRKNTGERFLVNKMNYKIGTDSLNCDLVLSGNSYVSRIHAEILANNNKYYLVDKNSTNKTYINGKIAQPEIATEICSGTEVRLGNEELIFQLNS